MTLEFEKSNFYCNKISVGETQEGFLSMVNHLAKWTNEAREMFS
jgi:hypothetical protein